MSRRERRLLAGLAVLAAVNLTLAVVLVVRQPFRSDDLMVVYDWCSEWLRHGTDVYARANATTDYPPHAIVWLSPITLVPERWIAIAWAMLSVALAPLLAMVVDRVSGNRARGVTLFTIAAFLCWASVRTLLQFSVLSMALAFVAVALADSRPWSGGVLLGLALAKPHIAGPVALWALASGRWRVVASALGTVAIGVVVYSLRAHTTPFAALTGFWHVLADTYTGAGGLTGLTSIRQWTASDAQWIAVAAALLVIPAVMAIRSRAAVGRERLAVLACGCLWALLAVYHNSNNMILMLPAFVLFLAYSPRIVAVAQVALMIDVPKRIAPWLADAGALRTLAANTNRVLVLASFALVVALWWRERAAADKMAVPSERSHARTSA